MQKSNIFDRLQFTRTQTPLLLKTIFLICVKIYFSPLELATPTPLECLFRGGGAQGGVEPPGTTVVGGRRRSHFSTTTSRLLVD